MFLPSNRRNRFSRGFTLIEVLIAIVILATGLVLIVEGMGRSQQVLRISENLFTASQIAEEKLAELHLEMRDRHKLNFGSDQGREQFPGRIFNWAKTVHTYSDKTIEDETKLNQADISVEWNEGPARQNKLELSSLILNREKK